MRIQTSTGRTATEVSVPSPSNQGCKERTTELNPPIYLAGPSSSRGHNSHADSERLSYINGVLHILRNLPHDLEPHEAAMLHRAMPPTLALPNGGGVGVNGQPGMALRPAGNNNNNSRNWVHVVVLFFLYFFAASSSWMVPKLVAYGKKFIRAEHEHGYIPQMIMAGAAMLQAVVGALCWFADSWPCRVMVVVGEYAIGGVRGAMSEFVDISIAKDLAAARGDDAADGGM